MLRQLVLCVPLICALAPWSARACQTALLLAFDVSNSIDAREYRIQTHGLADALADPEIVESLVLGQVALSVVQWSGAGQHTVSLPWSRMFSPADIAAFATRVRDMKRVFHMSDTGVGDVIRFSLEQFADVPDCNRRVIDVSGDGPDNAGTLPSDARFLAERRGVQVNALAIEGMGLSVTNFYRRKVITRDGFVMTARGHKAYAKTLRNKIRRETSQVMF